MSKPEVQGQFVTEAYQAEGEQGLIDFYRKWADDYDKEMLALGYISPWTISALLADHLSDTNAPILDLGASNMVTFTEDGGDRAGVHARNDLGAYLTILESSEYENETTGLSFSPDGKAMYVAYQVDGLLFEIRREDGLPFYGRSLNVAYHATTTVE